MKKATGNKNITIPAMTGRTFPWHIPNVASRVSLWLERTTLIGFIISISIPDIKIIIILFIAKASISTTGLRSAASECARAWTRAWFVCCSRWWNTKVPNKSEGKLHSIFDSRNRFGGIEVPTKDWEHTYHDLKQLYFWPLVSYLCHLKEARYFPISSSH